MPQNTVLLNASRSDSRTESSEQSLPTLRIHQPSIMAIAEPERLSVGSGPVTCESAQERSLPQPALTAPDWPEAAALGNHTVGEARPRSQRRFACQLLMNAWEEELAGLCESIDISAEGMRVRRIGGTRRRLRSTELVLEFQLPDSKELFRIAAVRERTDDGHTFFARFVGSPDRIRALTDRLTSSLTKLADGPRTGARQMPTHRTPAQRTDR